MPKRLHNNLLWRFWIAARKIGPNMECFLILIYGDATDIKIRPSLRNILPITLDKYFSEISFHFPYSVFSSFFIHRIRCV